MPRFNLTLSSRFHLSATAETFFESWKSLPPEVNIRLTPLNTPTGCRERLEQMLSQPNVYEITVATQAESRIPTGNPNELNEKTVLGFLAIKKEEKALDQLFVHPAAQGLGLGAVLPALAKTRLQRKNDGFWLRTAEGNLPACRFYEKKAACSERKASCMGLLDLYLCLKMNTIASLCKYLPQSNFTSIWQRTRQRAFVKD